MSKLRKFESTSFQQTKNNYIIVYSLLITLRRFDKRNSNYYDYGDLRIDRFLAQMGCDYFKYQQEVRYDRSPKEVR